MVKNWKLQIKEINLEELNYLEEMKEKLRIIFQKTITRIPSVISKTLL
jgi:hypothetical protein